MPEKLALLEAERSALISQAVAWNASQGRTIPAEYIEKDFWVTEALRSLSQPLVLQITGEQGQDPGSLEANIVFKGGTSLSKAFGLINRFSEDIDLFVVATFQKASNANGGNANPRKVVGDRRADTVFEKFAERVGLDIGLTVSPYPEKDARSGSRRAYQADYVNGGAVSPFLKPVVLIELTRMGSPQPNQLTKLESLLAIFVREASIPNADFEEFKSFNIMVLDPHRTLIEKLCALEHQSSRVAAGEAQFTGMARHFYDVGALLDSEFVRDALGKSDVPEMAREHCELSANVRRVTGQRPEGGFVNSTWLINEDVMGSARAAYDIEVPGLAYQAVPTFVQIQEIVRMHSALL